MIALAVWGVSVVGGGAAPSLDVRLAPAAATPDRLAQPTLPPEPGQADRGAQVYWLWCLPCHGDRGQGLTDEFRALYPPEENNCWQRGCHGKDPYEEGFVVPRYIPPLIGPIALQRFTTAEGLYAYISARMPYWNPGTLTEEEVWMVTAFLLRENGYWSAESALGLENAPRVLLRTPTPTPTPTPLPFPERPPTSSGLLCPQAVVSVLLAWWLYRRHPSRREKERPPQAH